MESQEIEYIVKQTTELLTNQAVREIIAGGWQIDETRQFTVLYRAKPAPAPPDEPSMTVVPAPNGHMADTAVAVEPIPTE